MELDWQLLERLCEAPGVPGHEERVAAIVHSALQPLVDELRSDAMGNLIGIRRGRADRRIMLAAHMDEIGFLVRYIDDQGFLRLQPVGGFDPRVLVAQRVSVWPRQGEPLLGALQLATKPIHLLTSEERKAPALEDLYVDLGLPPDDVRARIELGDMVTLARDFVRLGPTVLSKALDDRVGVFVMLEALRHLEQHEVEILAVATVQEEVGLRGAQTAAFGLEPDVGIALDVTIAGDVPGIDADDRVTRLGEGVAIKVFDTSHLPSRPLVEHLREIAERHGIRYQLELLPRGGTDAGAVQRTRAGVPAVTLSIPTRYVHTVNEMAHVADIAGAVELLVRYLAEAHERSYQPYSW
ncbi:M42 family metallopeptidase [Thermomicrobium sp. CFH 73360]|uniref:M42 family metallopeptidase n=1 Tax=Thermomicrobium sp. CFH 73360 TaxID=2951987 RepID=UPI0020773004|nr:M42 family metallopeptidase [Thermomicrobium sp. CFH 73360]MCM8746373.1 M42 family metallopeptidase [Thermomicrobium sp. CFH 73360]